MLHMIKISFQNNDDKDDVDVDEDKSYNLAGKGNLIPMITTMIFAIILKNYIIMFLKTIIVGWNSTALFM